MTFKRFEELPVWKEAMRLARGVFQLVRCDAFRGHAGLKDQLERAAVSVGNNLAEGYERGTTNELLMFLYIARGSAGEVRSMLHLLNSLDEFAPQRTMVRELRDSAESCGKQIGSWANQLQNSPITGDRHRTEAVQRERRAEAFLEKLRREHPIGGKKVDQAK